MNAMVDEQATTKNKSDDDTNLSRTGTVFWASLVSGSLIAGAAFIALGQNFGAPPVSILVICVGLSILLGAFGSTAFLNLQLQGVTVAGVAAICLVLFWFLTGYIQKSTVKIDIGGITRGAIVDLSSSSDQHIFGAPRGNSYRFIAFADDLDSKLLSLGIVIAAVPNVSEGRELLFDCVPRSAVERYLGSGETLQWYVDMVKEELVTRDDKPQLIARNGPCRKDGDSTSSMRWPSLISTAYAQAPTTDVTQSLRDLNSDSPALRRDARKILAAQGADSVKPMMQQWAGDKDSYRVKLGSAVALTEMLRTRKADRREVGAQLSESDLRLVAQSLSDEDRTVRIYASEFLVDLGDKRLASIALEQLPTANDEGQYNLARVLESVASDLTSAERDKLRTDLAGLTADSRVQLGSRTQEKLEAVANQPPDAATPASGQ